jgi:hypothetical protein
MPTTLTGTALSNGRRILSSRVGSQTAVLAVLIGCWEVIGRSVQSPLLPPLTAILTA